MVNFLGQVRNKRKTLVFNCFDVVFVVVVCFKVSFHIKQMFPTGA